MKITKTSWEDSIVKDESTGKDTHRALILHGKSKAEGVNSALMVKCDVDNTYIISMSLKIDFSFGGGKESRRIWVIDGVETSLLEFVFSGKVRKIRVGRLREWWNTSSSGELIIYPYMWGDLLTTDSLMIRFPTDVYDESVVFAYDLSDFPYPSAVPPTRRELAIWFAAAAAVALMLLVVVLGLGLGLGLL